MKMLKMNKLLGLLPGLIIALGCSAQAMAEDIALAGSYGSYLKSGCYWADGGNSGGGGGSNWVTVHTDVLLCPTGTPGVWEGEAAQVTEKHYSSGQLVSYSCNLQSGAASAQGNCGNYRIYK